ncbi:MAG: hypothetical protein PG981_000535 [Wolbachia endosymbiont of Ctenocephalides orientis wCori]|nr:MAG: hypothetical protein PG981_000535 [Wolbachia endosymbiont of Ctenocephalides orientis wCori]
MSENTNGNGNTQDPFKINITHKPKLMALLVYLSKFGLR